MTERKSLIERLPSLFPAADTDSTFRRFFAGFEPPLREFAAQLDDVETSLRIREASGQSLDLIGAEFGPLGRRRGRDDEAYRQFLTSLVAAFDGRGTSDDVEFAVGAGLAVDPSEVELREDFAANDYQVELRDWSSHRTGTVNELADLADPPAIPRRDPVYLFTDAIAFRATASDTTDARTAEGLDDLRGVDTLDGDGAFGGSNDNDVRGRSTLGPASAIATASSTTSTQTEGDGLAGGTLDGSESLDG